MNSIEQARSRIRALTQKSKFEKMVGVAAILTELLDSNKIRPIIVGGLAVELYTRNDYTTVDIDMVVSDRKLAGNYLNQLGFIPEGRHWYHSDLFVSIEFPGDMLEDADENRIVEIKLSSGQKVYVIGIEDIILDRLRACVHWKSASDCEWGRRMFLLHHKRLDLDYMRKMAVKDLTEERLSGWINEMKGME